MKGTLRGQTRLYLKYHTGSAPIVRVSGAPLQKGSSPDGLRSKRGSPEVFMAKGHALLPTVGYIAVSDCVDISA